MIRASRWLDGWLPIRVVRISACLAVFGAVVACNGSVSDRASAGVTDSGSGGSTGGQSSGGSPSTGGSAAALDASLGCPSESCIARAARIDAWMPASLKFDGGREEACCLSTGCGIQLSTVGNCVPIEVFESIMGDGAAPDSGIGPPIQWDGATPVCTAVPGTPLTAAECAVCIPPDTHCTPSPLGSMSGLELALSTCGSTDPTLSTSFHCEWFPDGMSYYKSWGAQVTCYSNPGHVVCGGGL